MIERQPLHVSATYSHGNVIVGRQAALAQRRKRRIQRANPLDTGMLNAHRRRGGSVVAATHLPLPLPEAVEFLLPSFADHTA